MTRSVGVNLKAYLGYEQTLAWCERVAEIASRSRAVVGRDLRLFVLPSAPALARAVDILKPTGVEVGAQNMHWAGAGPFTGEIDGALLAELGCTIVAIGHAERRRIFRETDGDVALKVAAAVECGLSPLVCIGENARLSSPTAVAVCVEQLESALSGLMDRQARVVLAYEPVWAIGAEKPAPANHVRDVCAALRTCATDSLGFEGVSVIYGGAAGPGSWWELCPVVDGLFLGRRAHDPDDLGRVLEEITSSAVTVEGRP